MSDDQNFVVGDLNLYGEENIMESSLLIEAVEKLRIKLDW
jgi:hypothetical protein